MMVCNRLRSDVANCIMPAPTFARCAMRPYAVTTATHALTTGLLCFRSSCCVRRSKRNIAVRAESKGDKPVDPENVAKVRQMLQKSGMTSEQATEVLDALQNADMKVDVDAFRKLMVQRSSIIVTGAAIQVLLDAVAASSAYQLGTSWVAENAFGGWTIVASGVMFILAGYFATGFLFDAFTLAAASVAAMRAQTDAATYLAAVKEMALTSAATANTGIDLVDKYNTAVSSAKVYDALQKIQAALKAEANAPGAPSTLQDLSSYLVLQHAEDKLGFKPEEYGLTDAEAGKVALEFAKYDLNEDFKLQLDEFQKMSVALKLTEVSSLEAQQVFNLLDTDNSNDIDFIEFVRWWVDQVKQPSTSQPA